MSDRNLTAPPSDARLAHLAASIGRIDRAVERERAQRQHHQGQPHARTFLPVMTLAEARESGAFRDLAASFEVEPGLPAGAQAYLVADGQRVALLTHLS